MKQANDEHVNVFDAYRISVLETLSLETLLLSANPYLFKAKRISVAWKLIESLLDMHLSISEEKHFNHVFGDLTISDALQKRNEGRYSAPSDDAEDYTTERAKVLNRFTREFLEDFCNPDGAIDWAKLVAFNSGNLDLDDFLDR